MVNLNLNLNSSFLPHPTNCNYDFTPISVYSFDEMYCGYFSAAVPVFQIENNYNPTFGNTNTSMCLNRILTSTYLTLNNLGVMQLGSDQLVSDELNPFYTNPFLSNIPWNIYPNIQKTIEIWFSIDLNPLPNGVYVLFYSTEIKISLVYSRFYCIRRYFTIQYGDNYNSYLELDLIVWISQLMINEEDFLKANSLPVHLSIIRFSIDNFSICLGIPFNFKPLCFNTSSSTIIGINNPVSETILSSTSYVIGIYHIAVYDQILTLSNITMLFDNLLFVSKKPLLTFKQTDYLMSTLNYF